MTAANVGPNGPVPQRSLASLQSRDRATPRRGGVALGFSLLLALAFAAVITPTITLDRWLGRVMATQVIAGEPAPLTVRVPGGIVIGRGELATPAQAARADLIRAATPPGPLPGAALFVLVALLATLASSSLRRHPARVHVVTFALVAVLAIIAKVLLVATTISALATPVAVFALVATLAVDRRVGVATSMLAAIVVGLLGPFDPSSVLVLLVPAVAAGIAIGEPPTNRALLIAGLVATACSLVAYVTIAYLTSGALPAATFSAPWVASIGGPLLATLLAVPLLPLYRQWVDVGVAEVPAVVVAEPVIELRPKITTEDALTATQPIEMPTRSRRESAKPTIELERRTPTPAPPLTLDATEAAEATASISAAEAPDEVVHSVEPAASASWTEAGASDAPWPELRGEPSEEIRVSHARGSSNEGARKRAATLPPTPTHRAPSVPPLNRRHPTIPPTSARYQMTLQPPASQRAPAPILDEDAPESAYTDATVTGFARFSESELRGSSDKITFGDEARQTLPADGDDEAARTAPSMPTFAKDAARRIDLPLKAPPSIPPENRPSSPPGTSLASRIDASSDEWSVATPVRAPTSAELRSLLGQPDPTRQQSIEEIERLHFQARGAETPEVDILIEPPSPRVTTRRNPVVTAEVDPDDIEAAIEIHPPARRTSSVGIAKPKKSE